MDNNEEYQRSIDLISQVESARQEARVIILDMKDVFSSRVNMRIYSEKEAFDTIEDVASLVPFGGAEEGKAPSKRPRMASRIEEGAGAAAGTYISAAEKRFKDAVGKGAEVRERLKARLDERKQQKEKGAAQQKPRAAEEVRIPPAARQQQAPAQQRPAAEQARPKKEEVKKAAEELHTIVPQTRETREAATPKQMPAQEENDLVLPRLTIPEQITELEKIALGLDRNVFNSEQLKVVKDEVEGLARSARGRDHAQGQQGALVALRDKKLKAALDRLRQANG